MEIEHFNRQFAAYHDAGPAAQHPPTVTVMGRAGLNRFVHPRIVNSNNLTCDFHCMRDENRIAVNVREDLSDACLSGSGRAVEQNRSARNCGGS